MTSRHTPFKNLVDTTWVSQRLDTPNVVVIDATFYLPVHGKNAHNEFAKVALPGAVFFDLDAESDAAFALPHMLPSAGQFADAMQRLGVSNDSTVVVYDQLGLFSAARLWWMLKLFGHQAVFVLNGGLPAWQAAGHPTPPGLIVKPDQGLVAKPYVCQADNRTDWVVDRAMLQQDKSLWPHVLDARPAERFDGQVPEPRAGMRSGHIPGSRNMPFGALVADGHLRPVNELAAILTPKASDTPITSCGSGITAAIITLALDEIDQPMGRLYDGSWADWGRQDAGTPVETNL